MANVQPMVTFLQTVGSFHPHFQQGSGSTTQDPQPSTPKASFPPGAFGHDSPTSYVESPASAMPTSADERIDALKARLAELKSDLQRANATGQRVHDKLEAAGAGLATTKTVGKRGGHAVNVDNGRPSSSRPVDNGGPSSSRRPVNNGGTSSSKKADNGGPSPSEGWC